MTNKHNKLVVFCGPSGAGKSTLAKIVMNHFGVFELSISATTRQPRQGEENGVHYWYISTEEFRDRIAKKEFLEYEEVYEDLFYGTLNSELDRIWKKGKVPFLDLDVKGAANLKEQFKGDGLFVFIHPGSIDELAKRLIKRGSETESSLATRLRRSSFEMEFASKFDYVLYNIDFDKADKEIVEVVGNYLHQE